MDFWNFIWIANLLSYHFQTLQHLIPQSRAWHLATQHSRRLSSDVPFARWRSTWDVPLLEQCFGSVSVSGCFQKRSKCASEGARSRRFTISNLLRAQRESREENGLSADMVHALFLLPLNSRSPPFLHVWTPGPTPIALQILRISGFCWDRLLTSPGL